MRKGLTQEDEAKFALLEPDGVSPMKRRQMAAHQGKVSQFKGGLVLAFGLIFLLYLAYPRPSAKNAFVAAAEDRKRSSATVSRGESDDIIIPSRATVTGTTLDFRSATSAIADSGDLGDTVVVGKSIISNTADDESLLTRPAVIDDSSASNGEGPSVIRHVAGGDENIDYPPPPPPAPSRGVFRFLNWLRGRKTQGTGRVAALISKLKQEIADGTHFEPGVMGQRLVEIERLERAEAEGEQKRKDAVATAQLEQQVKAAAAQRHDAVSEKMANIESLMTKYGGKHPDLVPQLRQLEKDLAHPDLAHPNQDTRIDKVRAMRERLESMSARGYPGTPVLTEREKADAIKAETRIEDEVQKEVDEEEMRQAESDVMRARQAKRVALRRKRLSGSKRAPTEEEEDDEEEVVVIRRPKRTRSAPSRPHAVYDNEV